MGRWWLSLSLFSYSIGFYFKRREFVFRREWTEYHLNYNPLYVWTYIDI